MDRFEPLYFLVLLAVVPLLVYVVRSNRRADRALRDYVPGGPAEPRVGEGAPVPVPPGGRVVRRGPESVPLCDIHPRSGASPDELKALGRALNVWLETQPTGTQVVGLHDLDHGRRPINFYAPQQIEMVDGRLIVNEGERFPAKVFGGAERATEEVVADLTESVPWRLYDRIVGPDPWHDERCQR